MSSDGVHTATSVADESRESLETAGAADGSRKRTFSAVEDGSSEENSESGNHRRVRVSAPNFDDDLEDCIVKPADITTTFDDVHVSQSTIEALDFLTMSILNPEAFTFGVLSRARAPGVLLYGPPGTGKSLLVRALAKQTEATMITLTDADVRAMYVGEGEKKIQRIFANARKNYPCIIFIDEADSIFGSRTAHNLPTAGHISDLSQFLIEIDGIKTDPTTSPMIIASTNRPYAMDEGILRRLGMRIMVDLPDATARERILAIHLKGEPVADDLDIKELAKATSGYTGSDLSDLVTAAARYAERENMARIGLSSPFQKRSSTDVQTSTSSPSTLASRRLTGRVHFLRAKDEIRPAPIAETVAKIREYHNMHGSTGYTGYSSAKNANVVNKQKPRAVV